jgi:uncharacterized protein (DUF2147 family)
MIRRLLKLTLAASAFAVMGAWAQETSPVGVWKTIDDATGKPKALVRISESHGELHGRIEKLFHDAGKDPNPKCEKCEGALKGQPVVGMTILTSMKKNGNAYIGGRILDPANGKVYNSTMALTDGGKKLEVRGYIGVPMLGRTQTWLREE